MDIFKQKELLRKTVYDNLFNNGFSNRKNGDYGKIPDFKGSDIAAFNLSKTEEWKKSKTIFSSPDSAQIPVRCLALKDSKNLIMASPNLEHGYLFLSKELSKQEDSIIHKAATKEGAFDYSSKIDDFSKFDNLSKIDLVVEGSVAVDKSGNRIGKGKGFADREIADLFEKNLISRNTPLITTIHPFQLVESVPMESHDMKLNMIVTTSEVIRI